MLLLAPFGRSAAIKYYIIIIIIIIIINDKGGLSLRVAWRNSPTHT